MRGKRLSEEVKKTIAMRVHNGEDKGELAKEFGLSEFTITDYARNFKSPRRVMKKVAPSKKTVAPTNNKIVWLRPDLMFYKNAIYKKVQDIE